MIKLYSIPKSTNVERVRLALGHKGIPVEHVQVPSTDRSRIEKVSGQRLVPVIEHDGHVVFDSTEILRYLEGAFPRRPLFPLHESRRAEMDVFIDWFNRVWKRPPNVIFVKLQEANPDPASVARYGKEMTDSLDLFEAMLAGRDYLMGEFSAADCIAYPFLRYALGKDPDDDYLFHQILVDYLSLGDTHPNLGRWFTRMSEHPQA